MNTIAERLRTRRKALNLTQKELAKKIGVSQGAIGQLESGRNQNTTKIYELAAALAVDTEWLLYGTQNSIDETGKKVSSNGFGVVSFSDTPIQFYSNFIKELGLDETQLACIQQTDESMSPTISATDYILCNTKEKTVQENAIFRIKRNNKFITRRIALDRLGAVIYRCDNPDRAKWQDIYALPDDEIVGKIVWCGSFRRFL
ncbi:MAG: helix-turn-helix transcriptional regulator [Neisseriaceae bacterium]|nr:helix-turn-helix transcriptional regulator [Bacteroidales bacterium]MBQ9258917.1 helix-turn-helix transcriptional regulator [Neisseriaceae bacterium]MBQ9724722.1 helix-turn-helix transcriptional regulator [Neisseriaceae bacterium]MBR1819530.1 helix-turn-helix transcriptional regulator [Neisseriaceae bacterium]